MSLWSLVWWLEIFHFFRIYFLLGPGVGLSLHGKVQRQIQGSFTSFRMTILKGGLYGFSFQDDDF